jgi:hypothetical protein
MRVRSLLSSSPVSGGVLIRLPEKFSEEFRTLFYVSLSET